MPSRAHFQKVARDDEGRPIPGVTVTVRQVGTENLIVETLYADDDPDVGTLTNPFTAENDGVVDFFLTAPKRVDVLVQKAGYADRLWESVDVFVLSADTQTFADEGTPLTVRPTINFVGDSVAAADNPGQNRTDVTIAHLATAVHSALQPPQVHTHASHSGIGADDHHAKSHGHTGADGSGTVDHANLTNVTANQHHNQAHTDSDHSDGANVKLATTQDITGTKNIKNSGANKGIVFLPQGGATGAPIEIQDTGGILALDVTPAGVARIFKQLSLVGPGEANPKWAFDLATSEFRFGAGGASAIDVILKRIAADVLGLVSGDNLQLVAGYLEGGEIAAPATPAANFGRLYVKDDAGRSRLFFKGDDGVELRMRAQEDATGGLVATSEGTSTTSYTDLGTVGPSCTIVVPSSGKILVGIKAGITNSGANRSFMSFSATGIGASDSQSIAIQGNAAAQHVGATFLITGLTPGSLTITAKYRAGAGTATFEERRIWAVPL